MSVTIGFVIKKLLNDKKKQEDANFKLWKELSAQKRETDKLESDKIDLENQIAYLRNRPGMIGLSYQTDNKNLQTLIDNVKDIFIEIQNQSCVSLRKNFSEQRQQYITDLKSMIDNGVLSCDNVTTQADTKTTEFAKSMASVIKLAIPDSNTYVLEQKFKVLINNVLTTVCKDGTLDLDKVNQLLLDILNAICYQDNVV